MARMSNTIGIAVSAMESHIKSGTIWCLQRETEVKKTPKSSNSNGNNNKKGELALGCHKLTALLENCWIAEKRITLSPKTLRSLRTQPLLYPSMKEILF
jgi:hypothetical protein